MNDSNTLPTTRSQAKELGIVRYKTGKPCLRGHISDRFTSTGQCSSCMDIHGAKWRSENPEKARQAMRNWLDRQPKKPKKPSVSKTSRELNRKYRLKKRGFPNANPDIRCVPIAPKVRWAIYYEKKKPDISATQKAYRERRRVELKQAWVEWYSKNRVSQIEKAAMRRQSVLMATPSWLTKEHREQISAIYFQSVKTSLETGIDHHVDHIVPIKGKTVCGLHVPWNLRVLPAADNLSKSNKLIDVA